MSNPMEAPVAEPVVEPVVSAPADPFSLDEARVASLSPEQRAALDPVIDEWRTRAKSEIEKTGKTYEEKYKPHVEKAEALERLAKDPRFVQWWNNLQQSAVQQNPQAAGAISQARPQEFASPEEWQNAMAEAYQGDPKRLQEIQQRMFAIMATPVISQLRQEQQQVKTTQDELRATLEMKDLFERHSDAKELDAIGRNLSDPNDKSESLLEMCLNWSDQNGKSMEEGYARAKSWSDALRVGAQKQAMGMVQDKKASVTAGPTTSQGGKAVVEVDSAEELMERNMDYLASGQTPPRFVIRKQEAPTSGNRWSQRT